MAFSCSKKACQALGAAVEDRALGLIQVRAYGGRQAFDVLFEDRLRLLFAVGHRSRVPRLSDAVAQRTRRLQRDLSRLPVQGSTVSTAPITYILHHRVCLVSLSVTLF